MANGRWRMFAHRYNNGEFHHLGVRRYVVAHGIKEPIVEVDVVEVADNDPAATHWGWMDRDRTTPELIYPREMLFLICFPYGVKASVNAGHGRVVRLAVTEVADA